MQNDKTGHCSNNLVQRHQDKKNAMTSSRMHNESQVMESSSFHLTALRICRVVITDCIKLRSTSLDKPLMA